MGISFQAELEHLGVVYFGDVTLTALRELYTHTRVDRWCALCRALGLYGFSSESGQQYFGPSLLEHEYQFCINPSPKQPTLLPEVLDIHVPGSLVKLRALGLSDFSDLDGVLESRLQWVLQTTRPLRHLFYTGKWIETFENGRFDCSVEIEESDGRGPLVKCHSLASLDFEMTNASIAKEDGPGYILTRTEVLHDASLALKKCLLYPNGLKAFALGFSSLDHFPPRWKGFLENALRNVREVRREDLPKDDPFLSIASSPVSLSLMALGFEGIGDLPLGWTRVLRLYLPSRGLPEDLPYGETAHRFPLPGATLRGPHLKELGYEGHWFLRVPSHLASVPVEILRLLTAAGDVLDVRGLASLSALSGQRAWSFTDSELSVLFGIGVHPAPEGGLFECPGALDRTIALVSSFGQVCPPLSPEIHPSDWALMRRRAATSESLAEVAREQGQETEELRRVIQRTLRKLGLFVDLKPAALELIGALHQQGSLVTFFAVAKLLPASMSLIGIRVLLMALAERFADFEYNVEAGLLSLQREGAIAAFLDEVVDDIGAQLPLQKDEIERSLANFTATRGFMDGALVPALFVYLEGEGLAERREGQWEFVSGSSQNRLFIDAFKNLFPEGVAVYKKTSEMMRTLQEYLGVDVPLPKPATFIGRLIKSPDVVLFERGKYIHVDHLNTSEEAIKLAAQHCRSVFRSGIPRFNLTKVFEELKPDLTAGGIPNVELLHALLRRAGLSDLGAGRGLSVFDRRLSSEQTSRSIEVEAYLESCDRPVSLTELGETFCEGRGWKEYALSQAITRSTKIISYDHGVFEIRGKHVIDLERLEELAQHLETYTQKIDGRVDLRVVQSDKPVLWSLLGGHPATFLCHCLRSHYPERFQYLGGYGVAHPSAEHTSRSADVGAFILQRGREVSGEELKREFVGRRGWTDAVLYNTVRSDQWVLRSSPTSFTHRDFLGWSPEKNDTLEDILLGMLKTVGREEARPFCTWSEIVETRYSLLPVLPEDQSWSPELVAALSRNFDSITAIELAFVRNGNSSGITAFEELLAYLVARVFDGVCREGELIHYLNLHKIYGGTRVPLRALEHSSPIVRGEDNFITLSHVDGRNHERFAP